MTHRARFASGVRVIRWPNALSRARGPEADERIQDLLGRRTTRVVVDLSGVPQDDICVLFMGNLIRAWRKVKEDGGDLRISSAPRHVTDPLKIIGLDAIFPNYATEQEAVDSFDA